MRLILLLVLYFFSLSVLYCQNVTDSLGRKQGIWVFEAKEVDSLIKGIPKIVCNFRNDTLNGYYRMFDKKGILRYEVNMVSGKRIGIGQIFTSSGRILAILNYEEDQLLSVSEFNGKGKIYETTEYRGGVKEGINILYYPNGKMWIKCFYINNMLEGEYIIYNRRGRVKSIFHYLHNGFI
jgi:antitoxin component YwqK of YwqJK toxin-antitoxin module